MARHGMFECSNSVFCYGDRPHCFIRCVASCPREFRMFYSGVLVLSFVSTAGSTSSVFIDSEFEAFLCSQVIL